MTADQLTLAIDGPVYVAVVGPPASGKSTLATALAAVFAAPIIRPRDAIRALLEQEPRLHELYAPINELGWISDGALGVAVRAAVWRVPGDQQIVILENLPGDANQLADLYLWAQRVCGRMLMVHLDTTDELLLARGVARRVCQACERDQPGEPHEPATANGLDPNRCNNCGAPLTTRRDDDYAILQSRTHRHRHYFRSIRATAEALDLPFVSVDAGLPVFDVQSRAVAAVAVLSLPVPRKGR